jgi:hypothetical protein
MLMPTKAELVTEIGSLLRQAGSDYASPGARDKHYGVWIFSVAFDEARTGRGAALQGVRRGPEAVFRGNPSDLNSPATYTYAQASGARRDWELHVDGGCIFGCSYVKHDIGEGAGMAMAADRSPSAGGSASRR